MKSFRVERSGSTSVMFAVCLTALLVGVGSAYDYSRLIGTQTRYQNYADIGVLAAASSGLNDEDALLEAAQDAVNQNQEPGDDVEVGFQILSDNTVRVTIEGVHENFMMGMFGKPEVTVRQLAEAPPVGSQKKLNLAIVLDVTQSMEGTKLADMKAAATGLIDEFVNNNASASTSSSSAAAPSDGVMMSLVPFAEYAKIPAASYSEPWLNVEPTKEHCWDIIDFDNSTNCRQETSGESSTWVCDNTVTKQTCQEQEFFGCMASRKHPWNERPQVGPTLMQGFASGGWCAPGSEIEPLTTDLGKVKTRVQNLYAASQTYIPAGLIWGWRTLTPEAPFTEANTPDKDERQRAMILMTDGENMRSLAKWDHNNDHDGVYHWGSDTAEANNLTAKLCSDIKADGITIYTIAFDVKDTTTQNLLRNCASDVKKAFNATNAAALYDAFETIGENLSAVRLSR